MSWMIFKRMAGAGWKNFIRGGAVSAATIVVMTVTLSIIGSLIFLSALLTYTLESVRSKVDITVYTITTASETDILALKAKIELLPQVLRVVYTSREDVLANFRARHAYDQIMLQGLAELGDNPFGASLGIKAKDPSQYESIANILATTPALSAGGSSIIDDNDYVRNKVVIESLSNALAATTNVGIAIILIFAIASVLIAFATIRLAIYTAKDEIGVMRLVGASNAYIRGPFIVVGVITGLLAGLIVTALLFPATWYAGTSTASWLGGFNLYAYYLSHLGFISSILILTGVFLGSTASLLAIRKYLKI